ncbi:MAG: AarF/UbiB family protein [Bacteroidetes bacterium]|nr:AarF/UbiB family protein [Bacteroidota bacterium]
MKEQDKIYSSRSQRTGKFIKTGAKVGANYLKHFSKKLVTGESNEQELQEQNAEDIYNALSNLKGSALKVAQMLSMDQGLLPQAYTDKFAQAQYSAPPLSYPLVVKTFQQYFKASPLDIFDEFSRQSLAAASIGQVHRAKKGELDLAVKIQYPGVANSISSDLKMVRPVVGAMFNISQAEMSHYLGEVEGRLMEETDYNLELERGMKICEACADIDGLVFPKYYPELSAERILTMDWLEGLHLDQFLKTNPDQETRNRIGQIIWDFYDFQIHNLREVHADPHPGNFLFREDGSVGVIDFGCVKILPEDFYHRYFQIMRPAISEEKDEFLNLLFELEFLLKSDSPEEVDHFSDIYAEILSLLGKPFFSDEFDFADKSYFQKIYALSDIYQNDKMVKKAKAARGPKDSIYLNRTYFGLYNMLHMLEAKIETRSAVDKLFLEEDPIT